MTAKARNTDPVTSYLAAETVNVGGRKAYVLGIIRDLFPNGCTQADVVKVATREAMHSASSVRTAFTELERVGLLERTDATKRMDSGRRAQIWRLRNERKLALEELVEEYEKAAQK